MKVRLALYLVFLISLVFPSRGLADGIIIPEPPICVPDPCPPLPLPMQQLDIKYHHVTVTIDRQVAVTHVDQVFYNPNDWQVEGTYVFPIPADAAVTNFTLWVDGKPVPGQVLDAEQARAKYEEIVRTMRDPALLEYAGQGAVQASIFPIPPRGERRIELEYTQALTAEGGLVKYIYPLNTEKFSARPLQSVSVSVEILSDQPIRAVYSSSHDLAVSRQAEDHVTAGYEAVNIRPDADFVLFYSVGESQALHLLTYRDPADSGNADGFFLVLLAPKADISQQVQAKDLILVLDRSGSMDGEKFQQAQEALRYILRHLNAEDRFNLIAFSTGLETYASGLRPASEASEALAWVDRLSAQGSTDINRALLEAAAMSDRERPTYLIFLTDGLPTEGVIESGRILNNFAEAASQDLRLFAFGVGYDVDTYLLDSLSQAHHGMSMYVTPGERLDEVLSAFYARISTPVLTNLQLDFGSLAVYDLYPQPLPDLFAGSQILAVGRYRQGGVTDLVLSGEVNGSVQTFRFPEQVFAVDSRDQAGPLASLPRLWATRKIGYLLNKVRLEGPDRETIDQIVKLSIRYGIVTPYTSYLVTEEMPLGNAAQEAIAGAEFDALQYAAPAPASGQEAVNKAADEGALSRADTAAAPSAEAAEVVRIAGTRTFVYSQDVWVDTLFDPDTMIPQKVPFLSEIYFKLAQSRPDLGAALALGERVIVVVDGTAYEVVSAEQSVEAVVLPAPVGEALPGQATAQPAVEPTVAAVEPTPSAALQETEVAEQAPSPDPDESLRCLGGLLPLGLWLGLWLIRRRR
ncbi:MAG: VWA domain-containing protein [Anaerolineales bacterium]|jgi:Ca-activated chloride channel family protein|nr:VWA domain-containing protein [Anaerolineales bacterium]